MKKLLLDYKTNLIRIAYLEDFVLKDLIIEDKQNKSIVSNIYVAKIKNILPSQFVFLDIGEERNAFLQLNDPKEYSLFNVVNGAKKLKLKTNQELVVQVTKDAHNEKGACVTSQLSFTGHNLVLLTNVSTVEIGVSKKIEDIGERKRLKKAAREILPSGYGLIMRTSCNGLSQDLINDELKSLIQLAEKTIENAKYIKGPYPLHVEEFLGEKAINELYKDDLDEIILDSKQDLDAIKSILEKINKDAVNKLTLHESNIPLFDTFMLESVINKLLHVKIWLKSGGFLTIEQTEACVVIDVNTGKFGGKKNHDETVFKTNLEASKEICRQIKLRNLSGMIIIDFIDMKNEAHKEALLENFKHELKNDRISTTIVGMTKLGLMQLTRKKNRETISNILLEKCTKCSGFGFLYSKTYVVHKIIKDIEQVLQNSTNNHLVVNASKDIIELLAQTRLDNLEQKYNVLIELSINEQTKNEYYDIYQEIK